MASSASSDLSSLYSNGDVVLENPIESSAILLIVVIVCASVEYIFALGKQVNSRFFQEVFSTLSEEVLVVGVLSLLLTFAASVVASLPDQWSIMLDWAHACLLFMAVMLITILSAVAAGLLTAHKGWVKFEEHRMKASPETHSQREAMFRQANDKFLSSLRVCGLPTDVSLAQYLLKAEKGHLVALANLTWRSWLALSTIVVLNALRTRLIPQTQSTTQATEVLDTTGEAINIASFIALCGYGTLVIFVSVHMQLQRRLQQYLTLNTASQNVEATASLRNAAIALKMEKNGEKGPNGGDVPLLNASGNDRESFLEDSQTFLIWRSVDSTMALLQAVFIFLVWYGAVFLLNALYHTFAQNIGITLLLICGAFAPLVAFMALAPWTLTIVAILGSFGTNVNEELVRSLSRAKLKASGGGDAAAPGSPSSDRPAEEVGITTPAGGNDGSPMMNMSVETKSLRPISLDDGDLMRLAANRRGGAATIAL